MPEELKVRIMVVSGTVLQSTLLDSPRGSSLDTETSAFLQWCPEDRDARRTVTMHLLVGGTVLSLISKALVIRSEMMTVRGLSASASISLSRSAPHPRPLRKDRQRLERWLGW